jgi:hypothetical protein
MVILLLAPPVFARSNVLPLLSVFFALFTSLGGIVAIIGAGLISDEPLSAVIAMSGGIWSAHQWFGLWPSADFSVGVFVVYALFGFLGFIGWAMVIGSASPDAAAQGKKE